MVQFFPRHSRRALFADQVTNVSLIGNVDSRRWRWNPFDSEQELVQVDAHLWQRTLQLQGPQPPEHTGFYAFRLVLNHNPARQLKASSSSHVTDQCVWHVAQDDLGIHYDNIRFKVNYDCELLVRYDSHQRTVSLTSSGKSTNSLPAFEPVERLDSYELNGFIWDELNMFDKFKTRLPGRSFKLDPDGAWSIEVPLKHNGGIDFRADGVYQFLISASGEEDYGFACLNDGRGSLVRGSGFSSSHGSSMHSGCTIRAQEDGLYRFRLLDPQGHARIEVQAPNGSPVPLLNQRSSIQLLGSVHAEAQFDPTVEGRTLMSSSQDPNLLEIELEVNAGDHVVNFGIANELFLDTMGFGCWFDDNDHSEGTVLRGMAWHGKPQEWNIMFHLDQASRLRFTYSLEHDDFSIALVDGPGRLSANDGLRSLSLVGDFEEPLVAWSPKDPANLMVHLGCGRYHRYVNLVAGKTYGYKYVGNLSDWQMVFADYELDGYGLAFTGANPTAGDPSQRNLKRYGQLTTHGNPPALSFTPIHSGPYRFFADVVSGAYSVHPI